MKKRIMAVLMMSMFLFSSCGREQVPQFTYNPVDIYVSDDVDILGNKIEGGRVSEIKRPSADVAQQETFAQESDHKTEYKGLEVYFIDVGQADAILIRIDGEDDILIDGGNNADGEDMVDYLRYLGVDNLSAVIATHPHEDHIGATDVIISEIPTDMIYMPYIPEADIPTTKTYKDLLTAISDNDVIAYESRNGLKIYDSSTCQIEIISPDVVKPGNLNDYSIVAKLTYGNTSFLFTGDAEEQVNRYIMENYSDDFLDVDVLKAGHHGSRTSNYKEWMDAVSPEYSVIMCEEGNSYGHPHKEAMDALETSMVYRTDQDGTIKMESDGRDITITTKLTGDYPLGSKEFSMDGVDL